MAKVVRFLFFLIISSMQYLALAQENNNQFIYKGFQGVNLQLSEYAQIDSNGLLQLTNTTAHIMGHAFFPIPLDLNSSSSDFSFSTNFIIALVPNLTVGGGHGMAFVISPSTNFSEAFKAEYLGLFNDSSNKNSSDHIFAVEFDTVQSSNFRDINNNHVGIDVNSLISHVSAPVSYYINGKNTSLSLNSGDPIHVWIDYSQKEKIINVTLAPTNILKPVLPLLSTPIDLSLIILDQMYVGFSASTGTLTSNQYVLGWSFNKTGQSQSLEITDLPTLPSQLPTKKGVSLILIIVIIVIIILVLCICIGVAAYFIRKKRHEEILEDWEKEYGPQRFSYKDLYKATKGFKASEILGEGGFGKVYRGVLASSNEQIAVKRISHRSPHGLRQFVAEIISMGRLRHRNLVQLLGYCRKGEELLLVYDYMPNGSLDMFLYSNDKPTLPWYQRFHILRGVASALFYLHEEWEQVVLHRDVKASNVMLDADMNGRLGDFGLARTHDHGSNPDTTLVAGTLGYLAPELARTGHATTATDVFAFGTFMLEMACGRRPVDYHAIPEELELVICVIRALRKGAILEVCDPKLEGDYVVEEMELVLKLGLLCSHTKPSVRPSIRQVMQYLSGDANLPEVEIPPDSAGSGVFEPSNEITSELIMSFHLSREVASEHSLSSTDSILCSTH